MNNDLYRKDSEDLQEYFERLCKLKFIYGMTWPEIAELANRQCGTSYSGDKFRKQFKRMDNVEIPTEKCFSNADSDDDEDILLQIKKERFKLSSERVQNNALVRQMAREETLKEIAHDAAVQVGSEIMLKPSFPIKKSMKYEGVLLIGDWHYGLTIDNIFNKFNTDIAKERIKLLQDETIRKCEERNITDLTVINLGDLIAGNIHLQLRINSQIDVITQIIEVSELYAEFLANLSQHFNVTTYSVLDNHSRIDPNKETSLQLESLARITTWYLKERLKNCNVKIVDNVIDENISTFTVKGFNIISVHGDLDKPGKIIERLSTFTQTHYDLIVAGHGHHFSANEQNNTMVICNGSLMATDDYAFKLRLNSKASQTLIIVSDDSPCEEIHRIVLN